MPEPGAGSRLFTLDTVRLILAPALAFIVTGLDRGYQTELWQHLARGRLVWQEGAVVSTDRFTFTVAGREFRDNNWLWQLAYYGLHSAGGLELVQVVNALTVAAALALLVRLCLRASGSTGVAGACGVAAFLGLWQTLLIRPQAISMLLFVLLYGALTTAQRNRPLLLALAPPLMALWANVHGGFAVGLALIFVFTAAATWRRLREGATAGPWWPWPTCLLACGAATLLNPYGWRVYQYAGSLSALGVARGIEEWLPPSPATLIGCAFVLSLAAAAALAAVSWRRLTALDVCMLGCFAVPGCLSVRMTVWWFLAAAPVVARLAGEALGVSRRGAEAPPASRRPSPAAVALPVIAAVCVASLPWVERYSPFFGTMRPAGRTEWHVRGAAAALPVAGPGAARVFTRVEWANYLAWHLEGRVAVFVEGHVELYPRATWSEFVTVNDGRPGWRDVLDRHRVRFLLLDETYHGPLLCEVRRSDQWAQRTAAGPALLFERRDGAPTTAPAVAGADDAGSDF